MQNLLELLKHPLKSEADLLLRCRVIEGYTLAHLAMVLGGSIPPDPLKRKGWVGQAVELALGASAKSKAIPDFSELDIELKTIPINHKGKPCESTFVTSIALLTIHKAQWKTSLCYRKLKRVLWLPIEADVAIPFAQRRIGQAFLWSPSEKEEGILSQDWLELSTMIGTGRLHEINASNGQYLQVRPKAANAQSLCFGFDEYGKKVLTLPRGFYLRRRFTQSLFP